jgi:hypothetical protein
MNKKKFSPKKDRLHPINFIFSFPCFFLVVGFLFPVLFPQAAVAAQKSKLETLIGSSSQKRLVETAADHSYSMRFKKASGDTDVINILAFRVEFKTDSNPLTTGDGLFGVQHDQAEQSYYNSDTVYKFDDRPHNRSYFRNQLEFVKRYFATVSRGKLAIEYTVFPADDNVMYSVPSSMSVYSPGYKGPQETWDNYYGRKTVGLMKFVIDAVKSADKKDGPFSGLRDSSGVIVDSHGHKTVFLILHAGASFLTDGGTQGSIGRNTPSDMIDVFVSRDFFSFFKDTLKLETNGVNVKGLDSTLLIDELMMCSETSNQDGLNFGIHGVLVNQVARQIGIPDLFSTSSGMTAVGGFCIMDPYGYSAANGFIPPWPSAWVRAYMGWDSPVSMRMGETATARITAVSAASGLDTTILLVPINDHEYYLIENRQRNLSGVHDAFQWDTASGSSEDTILIDPYMPANLKSKYVVDSISKDDSKVIISVKNYDAGIPASGILVWHVDENIIRDRLKYNMLNADSNFRAISLEEADGVKDLGILGRDIFYQPVFDFGGAEDIFPHFTKRIKDSVFVNTMNQWTKPSTHANDGGQTYLSMTFNTLNPEKKQTEKSRIYDHWVTNYADSVFSISVKWEHLIPGWPKRTVPEKLFDPAVFGSGAQKKLAVLSQSGRLYSWPSGSGSITRSGRLRGIGNVPYVNSRNAGAAVLKNETVSFEQVYYDSLAGAFTFPTVINGMLIVPSRENRFYLVSSTSDSSIAIDSTEQLPSTPSTYLCKLAGKKWALGCAFGEVLVGDDTVTFSPKNTVRLATRASVCAVAALAKFPDSLVCIQTNDSLSLIRTGDASALISVHVDSGIPPYSLVTADINRDSMPEIIVCDSRKGLWVYKTDLTLASGWENSPNQWAAALDTSGDRRRLPENLAPPSLADVNGDGFLDILVGGTSGMFALNFKGVRLNNWPAVFDNRFWRGNITSSPVVTKSPSSNGGPLVIYHSATGENETWEMDSIKSVNKTAGTIVYVRPDGSQDSITGVTASFIDSALTLGDSLISPFVLPGGFVDALDKNGKRPLTSLGSNHILSQWPLTVGAGAGASPLLDDFDNDGKINLIAVARNGWVYRWKLGSDVIGDSIIWRQVGYNSSRPFAFLGASGNPTGAETQPITFFSWPNPTNGSSHVWFKYKFSAAATDVRLDVFTLAGFHVLSKTGISGSFPDYNELSPVSLATFGPGVYRCRLEAKVAGAKYVSYWKMAVVK